MKPICLDPLIREIEACVARHKLTEDGEYARWTFGEGKDLGRNEYGCADAANILYTIGAFPRDEKERAGFVKHLRAMQNPETGMYSEPTHHTIHTTAHCLAALELFDAGPLYPCTALARYTDPDELCKFLETEVSWSPNPWSESHKGAGIFVCLTMTNAVDLAWKNRYFQWMWDHTDEKSGFFFCGDGYENVKPHVLMAGGFHYMFNHEADRRPYRSPEKIIDFCLRLMEDPQACRMQKCCTFIDIDVIFSLNRAMRQSCHRFDEAKAAIEAFAEKYLDMMLSLDYEHDTTFNDLHMLFGAVCCLAELQTILPGKLLTTKPLRLVLDRRPFI